MAVAGTPDVTFRPMEGIGSGALDIGQGILGIVGLIPVFGNAADVVNAVISGARGNYEDAVLDGASAIPGTGQVTGAASAGIKFERGVSAILAGVGSIKKGGSSVAGAERAAGSALSRAQRNVLGAKLSTVADKTPRELLQGRGGLSRLQRVPGGTDVDSTLADLASRSRTDRVARRTLKELKKHVPNLDL